jgi:two-component system chemotaxis response regulator CheB
MPVARDIVVIGASSGGVEALKRLVPLLPQDLPAAIFIVMHLPVAPSSVLHEILQRCSGWPVLPAIDGAIVRHGIITVAVNDHHLLFDQGRIRLTRGPRENRTRPSIDATLRSAAVEFGPRTIGAVLTGNLDDGTAGLWAVKDRGEAQTAAQQINEAFKPQNPLTTQAAVSSLIAAPIINDVATRVGKGESDSSARSAIPQIEEPSQATLDLVKANFALQKLTDPEKQMVLDELKKAEVTVNPRYGAYDTDGAQLEPAKTDWLKVTSQG